MLASVKSGGWLFTLRGIFPPAADPWAPVRPVIWPYSVLWDATRLTVIKAVSLESIVMQHRLGSLCP